jgi:hypothetical protein
VYCRLTVEDVIAARERDAFGPAFDALLADLKRVRSRRLWGAILLALDLDTCVSILSGRRVFASNLDGLVFRRALRGDRLPPADTFVHVTDEMLDAVAECGPLEERNR